MGLRRIKVIKTPGATLGLIDPGIVNRIIKPINKLSSQINTLGWPVSILPNPET